MTTEEKKDYLQRIYGLAQSRGLCRTKGEFAALLGINNSVLSAAMNGNEKFLTDSMLGKVRQFSRRNQLDGEEPDPQFPPTSGGVWLPAETAQLYNNMSETIRLQAEMLAIYQRGMMPSQKNYLPNDGRK